jgi:hypothetical protein
MKIAEEPGQPNRSVNAGEIRSIARSVLLLLAESTSAISFIAE